MDTSYEKYVGTLLDGRYEISKVIGIGGMAVVFEAYDTKLSRSVAIKLLKEDMASDAQSVKRFINESKAVSMLSHPNIVRIFDISVKEHAKYIVMERVKGITLKTYMENKGRLPVDELLSYSEQILMALEHAHSKGIIHRDIKPQNIMLLGNGKIKVADFGIAKLPNAETVTMTDKAIGTVFYISPEQASGRPIDQRSDLYSLGVMMYEMATGKLPFNADSPVSVALMQVRNQPQRPHEIAEDIPHGLEQIIMAAMKKNPKNRFQSATQMLKYVRQLRADPSFEFKTRKEAEQEDFANRTGDFSTVDAAASADTADQKIGYAENIQPKSSSEAEEESETEKSENEDGKDMKKKRKQSRSMFPVIFGVASAFLAVVVVAGILLLQMLLSAANDTTTYTVDVPHLVGSVYSDRLASQFDPAIYKVEVIPVYSSDYPENTIITQEPNGGEKRKVRQNEQYCMITLKICKGSKTVVVPNLTYLSSQQARMDLDNLGLKVSDNIVKVESQMVDAGYVVSQSPASGETLAVGSSVTLYVSEGYDIEGKIDRITVSNFVGLTEKEAAAKMKNQNGEQILRIGKVTEEYSDTVEAGKIISQSLVASTTVVKGSTINFVFSLGPENPETDESDSSAIETEDPLVTDGSLDPNL